MGDQISEAAVRLFLQEHPAFTEVYFAQNATAAMVQKWFQRKSNNKQAAGHLYSATKFSLAVQPEVSEDDSGDEGAEQVQQLNSDSSALRRNSEPYTQEKVGKKAAFESRAMRKKKALTHAGYRPTFSKTFDESDEVVPLQFYSSKRSLRKTQSAPICKNIFNQLINSSVYLHSIPTHNRQHIMDLWSASKEYFMTELIHDIMQDLNLRTLCSKIIANIGLMTKSDVGSLYLVEKQEQKKVLKVCYEQLRFDELSQNMNNAKFDGRIKVLRDGNEIGSVLESGKAIISTGVHENAAEPLSNATGIASEQKVDGVNQVLHKPIKMPNGEVVGIISLGGKSHSWAMETQDDKVLERYLTFCAISLINSRIFGLAKEEFDRNKALLQLAHDIFEEQTSLTNIMNKVMRRALGLFSCKECKIFLIADIKHTNLLSDERFSHIFRMHENTEKSGELQFSSTQFNSMDIVNDEELGTDHVIDFVSMSGEGPKPFQLSLQVFQAKEREMFGAYNSSVVKRNSVTYRGTRNEPEPVLCLPIRNNRFETIGVVKLIRKTSGDQFNEKDEQMLEAFTIFCGLGVSNCILYDKVCRAKAHQKVALEVISYHTSASQKEVERLKLSPVPSAKAFQLKDLHFDDFQLRDDQMLSAAIRMFTDFEFLKTYRIENQTLYRWLLTVKKNYRRVIYHNWRHAFNVAQAIFAILTTGKISELLTSLECLALLVGCLCHDLDHRGTNNEFQTKSESALGQLYGTSIMEHHHFNHAVAILNSEGNNIFQNLNSSQYKEVMQFLKHAILATDLAQYFKIRKTFEQLIEGGTYDFNKKENRSMLRGILMTSSDLCGITKPWEVQKKIVHLVTSEFFHQGDIEREQLQVEPQAMMNREHILQLPKLQLQFFDTTGIPVYKTLSSLRPELQPLLESALSNRRRWKDLSDDVDNGKIDPELEPLLQPVNNSDGFTEYP